MIGIMNQKIACLHKRHKHAIQSSSMADLEYKFNYIKILNNEPDKNKI